MLSKKDKEWLTETIRKEIKNALTVKVKWEKKRDMKTGKPLAVPDIEIKDVYLPDMWVEMLPFQEGAFRGLQKQVCLSDNKISKYLGVVNNILLENKDSLKCLASITDRVKELDLIEVKKIEDKT